MNISKKIDDAKKSVFKQAENINGYEIKGPDFSQEMNLEKLINSYKGIGFQASNLWHAVQLIKKMHSENAKIYLAYSSGMVSSGLREVIRYLVEHNFVDVLITTTGGVEEDLIKCLKNFVLGEFDVRGKELRERGINRIGNIFVPNDRYVLFEEWIQPVLRELLEEQKKGTVLIPSYFVKKLGEKIQSKESIYYWAYINNIPVFVPAPLDGSLGDMVYFFKQSNPEFKLEVSEDLKNLIDLTLQPEKIGLIVLGGGMIKHAACNANLFRNGADYAVYINTSEEFDGSEAGAKPDEAVSWGKIKPTESSFFKNSVKIHADATLVFPLIVAGAFKKEN